MSDTMQGNARHQSYRVIQKNAVFTATLREAQGERLARYLQCGGGQDCKAGMVPGTWQSAGERSPLPRIVGERSLIVTNGGLTEVCLPPTRQAT